MYKVHACVYTYEASHTYYDLLHLASSCTGEDDSSVSHIASSFTSVAMGTFLAGEELVEG